MTQDTQIILIFEDETLVHDETLRNLTNARTNERDQQSGEPSKDRELSEFAPPKGIRRCNMDVEIERAETVEATSWLFAPILYPADKLPSLILSIHDWMPFVPIHRLLTGVAFPGSSISHPTDLFVVLAWCLLCVIGCLAGLSKRR